LKSDREFNLAAEKALAGRRFDDRLTEGCQLPLGSPVLLQGCYNHKSFEVRAEVVGDEEYAPDGYHADTGLYCLGIKEDGGRFFSGASTWADPADIKIDPTTPSPRFTPNKVSQHIPA